MTTAVAERLYICPGETHPISRSVHLARLAAFYPKCRECPLRCDTGQIATHTIELIQNTERRVRRPTLFGAEGVRGVYLNELTRADAGRMAQAFASLLWEESPPLGRADEPRKTPRRTGPSVVIGYDERPFSPDITTGVAAALKRSGCQVVDIQMTTKPCLYFAVEHLQAAGGIYVTGSGCDPSWTGLDFVGRRAQPLSQDYGLERLEARLEENVGRPARHAVAARVFQAHVPYEASLWKHFHALRPLRIACACPSRLIRQTLDQLFAKLPCKLVPVETPRRARRLDDPRDRDIVRLGQAVRDDRLHLGVLIDDDGQSSAYVDERGKLVSAQDVAKLVARLIARESAGATVVLEQESDTLQAAIAAGGGTTVVAGRSLAAIYKTMREQQAAVAGGDSGRMWFGESVPTCDAILTLSRVLSALSQSDLPFSEAVAQ